MHRHEMQQSNIYLGIYTIEYYFLLEKSGCYTLPPIASKIRSLSDWIALSMKQHSAFVLYHDLPLFPLSRHEYL
jgi:hypothetical protein